MREEERGLVGRYIQNNLIYMPRTAKEMTEREGRTLPYRNHFFKLKKRVDDFIEGSEERLILMPGLRGVGKSTLLFQLYNYLTTQKNIDKERVLLLFADELKKYLGIGIYEAVRVYLEDILRSHISSLNQKIFLLIDEAHFDSEWGLALKLIYDRTKNIFVVVTGSSALSIEMSADVSRRALKEPLYPLTFSEYLHLKYAFSLPPNTRPILRKLLFSKESQLEEANALWNHIKTLAIRKKVDLNREFESFLLSGGFPFALSRKGALIFERINDMVNRIVDNDVLVLHSFNAHNRSLITRLIFLLAAQKPGGLSDSKLAQRFGVSSRLIRTILDIIEKTHLVFSVKPYGGAGKVVRKPWKYYFLSPSLAAALRYKLGLLDVLDKAMFGVLAEHLVSSSFLKLKETDNLIASVFYDPRKKGVDFLLQRGDGRLIPIEVSFGRKEIGQIANAVRHYKAEYGIVISDTPSIKKEKDILYIPLSFFSFL